MHGIYFLLVLYFLYFLPLGFAIDLAAENPLDAGIIVLVVTLLHNVAGAGFLLRRRGDPGAAVRGSSRWGLIRDRYARLAPWIADVCIEIALFMSIYVIVEEESAMALASTIVAIVGNAFCLLDNLSHIVFNSADTALLMDFM